MSTRKPGKKRSTKRPPRRPSAPAPRNRSFKPEPSAPEITTEIGPAGRDTMAAIAAELAPDISSLTDLPDESGDPGPDIEVGHGHAGRETLAAIAHEMLADVSHGPREPNAESGAREQRHTVSYEERPLTPPRRPRTNTLDYTERPALTKRSPHGAQLEPLPPPEERGEPNETYEIHEMVTFVVRGELARLSSTSARRDFVRDKLIHRLPVKSIDEVDRIDVTPWTVRGTVIVRVWCRI